MGKYYREEDLERALIGFIRETGIDEKPYDYAVNVLDNLSTIEVSEDCISRQQAIEILCRSRCGERARGCPAHYCPIINEYDNLPSVAPSVVPKTQMKTQNSNENSNEDAISREYVKGICEDMLDEEMLGHMLGYIEQAPSVIPQPKVKIYGDEHDCIMTLFGECSYSETGCGSCAVVEKVRDALTKTQMITQNSNEKSKEGEWIAEKGSYEIICSNCECEAFSDYGEYIKTDYCPHCGAKMKGSE